MCTYKHSCFYTVGKTGVGRKIKQSSRSGPKSFNLFKVLLGQIEIMSESQECVQHARIEIIKFLSSSYIYYKHAKKGVSWEIYLRKFLVKMKYWVLV